MLIFHFFLRMFLAIGNKLLIMQPKNNMKRKIIT